jgi:hypothetical protein
MTCQRCGLPDNYGGQGDGIGSCECSRCECCAGAPYECECGREFDPLYDDPDEPYDYLCNDESCPWRRARVESRDPAVDAPPLAADFEPVGTPEVTDGR